MKRNLTALLLVSMALAATATLSASHATATSAAAPAADAIGGGVTGPNGSEAGVWVIAETKDLPTPYIKIVVTDDQGRFVIPELPKAKYKVWVRGYGLTDSKSQPGQPGQALSFNVVNAKSAREAAEIYPASYWLTLLKPPAASEFPGTRQSNGINPAFLSQQDWLANLKENCEFCHQEGDRATRIVSVSDHHQAWDQRVQMAREPGDTVLGPQGKIMADMMNANMDRFGRQSAINAFADWSTAIAKGALPTEAPPRPTGLERNVVITLWDYAGGHFIHDIGMTDKRDPTMNGGGLVYGVDNILSILASVDPRTSQTKELPVPGLYPENQPQIQQNLLSVHTPTFDRQGRVWISLVTAEGGPYPGCDDGPNASPYTKYFPNQSGSTRRAILYDPKTGKFQAIPTCFGEHHIAFGNDKDNTLYFSGDSNVIGWLNTRMWDQTHDAMKSQGWCPFVVDTKGDGKIDPDRSKWQEFVEGGLNADQAGEGLLDEIKRSNKDQVRHETASIDPTRDTRVVGYTYGISVNPKDDSVWIAKQTPLVPSGIFRFEKGAHPPQTCKTEYYQPPKLPSGDYVAFNARGVDVDSKGIVWTSFGSGAIGRFDRSKCKVLKGPTAVGQGCPEGWTITETPGPKLSGQRHVAADWYYSSYVDRSDVLGLGTDVPVMPGANSDSLVALIPGNRWVVMRVPYPMGFYGRGVDGRIDDPSTGWKGKALWSSYSQVPVWHQEDGEGAFVKLVKFQVRPNPLAY